MMGLLGRKLGMMQIPDENTGGMVGVTVVKAGPCYVLQVKTKEKDGYNALKIGFGEARGKNLTLPEFGELKKAFPEINIELIKKVRRYKEGKDVEDISEEDIKKVEEIEKKRYPLEKIIEIKLDDVSKYKPGDVLKVSDIFKEGDIVDVTGLTKGKGFAGGMKRWGFHGGPASHGSKFHRRVASIGQMGVSHVWKGKRMPGHLGAEKVTILNLKVIKVIPDKNLILIKGGIPGPRKGIVFIRKSKRYG